MKSRRTIAIIFMTVFFSLSVTFSFLAQGNLQNINVELQTQTLLYFPFLVQQNLFLMEAVSTEESICQNKEKVNDTLSNLVNEAQYIFDEAVSRGERLQTAKEEYEKNSKISLTFLSLGFLFVIVAVWPKKKLIKKK